MRILVLSNLYPPNVVGGYERLCFDVTTRLVGLGHEVTVLTSSYGDKFTDYPGQRIIRDWQLLIGEHIYAPFGGTREARDSLNRANLAILQRALECSRPEVIFAWNLFFLDSSILDALEANPVRTVLMLTDNWLLVMRNPLFVQRFFHDVVHGDQAFRPPSRTRPWPGFRRSLKLWPRVRSARQLDAIFGSCFVRDLYAAGSITFDRHRVVHNGVDQGGYAACAQPDRAHLVEPGTLKLLFAGRLVDLKGAHCAVAALRLLDPSAMGLSQIRLTIVGDAQDATYRQSLADAIMASGRHRSIALQPSVPADQLPALFRAHDVYLFPSLYEPFALTLIHALALGIPTVATRVGGNVEIIRHGQSGLLVNKNRPDELAQAIRRLHDDGELRVRLADGGRRASGAFTLEHMVAQMENFLFSQR